MSSAARLAAAALLRAPARTAIRVAVLAVAVAMLGSMALFVSHSLRTIAGSAVRSVPLDWQGPVSSQAGAQTLADKISHAPTVLESTPAATAPFVSASHTGAAGTTNAGSGALLAVAPGYGRAIHTYRFLHGSLRQGAIVLDQQLAATLQARVGDTVTITPRAGTSPRRMKVSGVALITAPDLAFQPLNPLLGPAPAQPPANAAVMPLATFAKTIAPGLPALASAAGNSAVPGAQTGVQWQVDVQLRPHVLNGTPAHALARAAQIRRSVERSLPGQVQFVDNLEEQLETASGDALYAETLYIMLAVPGALVALGLAYLAALGTVDRDRRDLALLRARGATRRALVGVALVESAVLGLLGGLLGAAVAFAAVSVIVPGGGLLTTTSMAFTLVACVALAALGAAAARLSTTRAVWSQTVSENRRGSGRGGAPLWQRLYLDLIALAVSGLIYWLTASTGFSAVVNPDSNPTLALSVYMFFAPALLWIGATLLLVRVRGRMLGWLARTAAGPRARDTPSFLLASAGRRGTAINRGLIVVGLLLAFGVSLGVFTATYDQQAKVDAQLTLGADVAVSAPPGATAAHHLAGRIAAVPGVSAASSVDHSYAYVGPDLQDTFGVDPATIARATTLRDSYFLGSSAAQAIVRLHRRDAILVSKETITDYDLKVGDPLNLRVLNHRDGRFHVIRFHVAGVVQEFPSAPRDSFMVANLSYLESADGGGGPNLVFAKAGDPRTAARKIAGATSAYGTSVKSISEQLPQTGSAITTVDLHGISDIEEAFTVALAAAAMALFFALEVIERRHEFATMAALGATLPRIGAFIWSEAALVLVGSLLLATVLGTLLAMMLVAMLQHVFDPPPDHLAIPWRYLAALAAATLAASGLAAAITDARLRRLRLGALLREQ